MDECLKIFIEWLNRTVGIKTLACCCGHLRYPMTIVTRDGDVIFELISGIEIPRKKRFYKKNKEGYYFIPEVMKER